MRSKIALLLIFVLTMGMLSSCGGNEVKKSSDGKINACYYAYNSEPILNWDPSIMSSNGIVVLNNIYEPMLRFDAMTKEFEYVLVESYEKSEDSLTWTFKIRQGIKFHDGTDLNAEAVKFSIDRTRSMGKGFSYIWKEVESINVIDDYTVEFKLSSPAPLDIVASCGYASFIMSPAALEKNGDDWYERGNEAGTGPYVLESNSMGDEVILSKFDGYWKGWDGSHFDKVIIKKIPETSSRRQMIESGEADFTFGLPSEDVEAMKGNKDISIYVEPSLTNMEGFINTQKPPLDRVRVRQALSYAFPYDDVINYTAGGYGTKSRGIVPEGMWGGNDTLFQYDFDLDKAKALLEEEGIKEGELKLIYTYVSGDEAEKKAGELYKAELSKIGVELEIRGMPWESQWEMGKATNPVDRQDIFVMYGWPITAHPHTWFYSNIYSEEDILFNLGYYSNKDVDRMIDEAYAMSAKDIDRAEELILDIQKIIIEECPILFMYDKQHVWTVNSSVQGFKYNPVYSNVVFFYDCYRK